VYELRIEHTRQASASVSPKLAGFFKERWNAQIKSWGGGFITRSGIMEHKEFAELRSIGERNSVLEALQFEIRDYLKNMAYHLKRLDNNLQNSKKPYKTNKRIEALEKELDGKQNTPGRAVRSRQKRSMVEQDSKYRP